MLMKIKSWNNICVKKVHLQETIDPLYTTIPLGNQNSYSDCNIPISSNSLITDFSQEIQSDNTSSRKLIIDPSLSIGNYIQNSREFLYGIPGSPYVSIGGAIAADTHGKDGKYGKNFGSNIDSLYLKIASGDILKLNNKNNPEILESTIGGYGLTGQIVGVEFLKSKIKFADYLYTELTINKGVDNLINEINQHDEKYFLAVIDLVNNGYKWIIKKSSQSINQDYDFPPRNNKEALLPLNFVGNNFLYSLKLLNFVYPLFQKNGPTHYTNYFFPQGGVRDPRNFCKNRKIVEVQFSLPMEMIDSLKEILDLVKFYFKPLACSIKILAHNIEQTNLSFYQHGISVNFDFPFNKLDHQGLKEVYKKIYDNKGKVNLSKDLFLSEDIFKKMYPEYQKWIEVVKTVDPKNKFQSQMSHRLKIK